MTWTSFVGAGALVPRDGDLLFVRQSFQTIWHEAHLLNKIGQLMS